MLSVIIVDYNSIEQTAEYIIHLTNMLQVEGELNFVIVDNYNDLDRGIKSLSKYFKVKNSHYTFNGKEVLLFDNKKSHIVYKYSDENLGYAKGNNLGVEVSNRLFDDKYILISNNDILLQQKLDFKTLDNIFTNDNTIAVIGPRILGKDGKPQSPHKKIGALSHLFTYYWCAATGNRIKWNGDLDYTNQSKYVYRVMGSFMFIRKDYFIEAGMFDPATFMFAEESILSERLLKRGYKTYFCNDFEVIHNHGESVKKNASVSKSIRWSFDSVCYYYEKYMCVSHFVIMLAKINFQVYLFYYKVKNLISGLKD